MSKIYKKYYGDTDIFVPLKNIDSYLFKHNLGLEKLSNGVYLISATRNVTDEVNADIQFHFPSGAYNEPENKSGINHVLEHIISNTPGHIAKRSESYYNASTQNDSVKIYIQGVANAKNKKYGIWPVIPSVFEQIGKNFNLTKKELESEKQVIYGEMQHYESDHDETVRRIFGSMVYDKKNPASYLTIGSKKDVSSLTVLDIKKRLQRIFIPKDLYISVFNEGIMRNTQAILTTLKSELANLPASNLYPQYVADEKYALLNKEFKQGSVNTRKTHLPNKLITIAYFWIIPGSTYTTSTFTTSRFFEVARQKFFKYFRERGLGYSGDIFNFILADKWQVIGFQMTIPKREGVIEFATSFYPQLRKIIFETFDKNDCNYITTLIKQRLQAVPITIHSRFNDAIYGQREYGKIIDSTKVTNIYLTITAKHLEKINETLLSISPAISIIGDID